MSLSPGTRVGPYEIVAAIGAGGMGEVYRAKDSRLGRDVAIKVLPESLANDAGRRERFEREAKAVAALSHPNIINIFDTGLHDGHPFVVMELLDGETLRERLTTGALPVRKAVEIAVQIARGLGAAHEKRIAHRDLKPENIFIIRDGQVKILDFGLARDITTYSGATGTAVTDAGIVMGTVGYMAPEQIRAQVVDGRTDLFAFGAVLFEMLTGVRAFQRETSAETMTAILKEDVPDLIGTNAQIPLSLDRIVRHCLEKTPAERFQSARDVAFAIGTLSDSVSVLRESPGPDESGRRSGAHEGPAPGPHIVELTFGLSASVCRKLDRSTLDPRVIGDHIYYTDNGIESDTLVCFLHGTGLDHSQFEHVLKRVPYRAVAPTLYGCEPNARRRLRLSGTDHLIIVREWLRHLVQHSAIRRIVLVGFSTGADLCLRFVAPPVHDPTIRINGLLALDANVSLETCWLTQVLARMITDHPSVALDNLRSFGANTSSIREWLNIHEYLVKVLRKFHGDLDVLASWGAEFAAPFKAGGLAEFGERYRTATRVVPNVQLVVSEQNEANRNAVLKVKLMNLDGGFLGEAYSEDSIVIEPDADHFDLLQPSRLIPHLESVVAKASQSSVA